jgi:hypothetical protein
MPQSTETVEFCLLRDVHLLGPQHPDGGTAVGDGSKGVYMQAGAGNVYQNRIRDVYIQNVDEAVRLDGGSGSLPQCNGNEISGVMCTYIGTYVYNIIWCNENTVCGGFTSQSNTCQAIIRCGAKAGSDGGFGTGAAYCLFYGVQAEPGSSTCVYYRIEGGCQWIQVHGHSNCANAPVDNGTQTIATWNGQISTPQLAITGNRDLLLESPVTINASAGRAAIANGASSVTVLNNMVLSTSLVIVTPISGGGAVNIPAYNVTVNAGSFSINLLQVASGGWLTFGFLVIR